MRKLIVLSILVFVFTPVSTSTIMADDTELYVAGIDTVAPNVLIIFDNSASMNREMSAVEYDPAYSYPNVLGIDPNAVYYKSTGNSWDKIYRNTIGEILCADARDALSTYGFFNGRIMSDSTLSQ